jgi:hypothetical protein
VARSDVRDTAGARCACESFLNKLRVDLFFLFFALLAFEGVAALLQCTVRLDSPVHFFVVAAVSFVSH